MKKVLIPILVLGILVVLSSCDYAPIITTTQITTTLPAVTTTITTTISAVMVIDPNNGNTYIVKQGSVGVGNADTTVMYVLGQTARGTVFILNGSEEEKTFSITVKPYSGNNWTPAPNNIQDWVNFNNSPTNIPIQVVVPQMNARAVEVALTVPAYTVVPRSWAFVVSIIEYPPTSVQVENTSLWKINMR